MNGFWFFALALGALFSAGCHREVKTSTTAMVAGLPATLETGRANADQLAPAAGAAFALMAATLEDLDPDRPDSDINKLNRVASTVRIQVSRNTFRLIDLAHHYSGLTGGALDLSALPLEKAWGLVGKIPEEEPSPELLEALRIGVGRDFVQIFDQGAVAFTSPNTQINLGRMGAAYALDVALLDLRRRGFSDLRLQLGGFQRTLGRPATERAWIAQIPHPFLVGTNIGSITLEGAQAALAVLHLYDPPLRIGDAILGGILDPRRGRPAEGTVMVAASGPSATLAAALAQALIVSGVEGANDILAAFPKCEAMLIADRKPEEIWMTSGWSGTFKPAPAFEGNQHILEREVVSPEDGGKATTPAQEL